MGLCSFVRYNIANLNNVFSVCGVVFNYIYLLAYFNVSVLSNQNSSIFGAKARRLNKAVITILIYVVINNYCSIGRPTIRPTKQQFLIVIRSQIRISSGCAYREMTI